ncbi:MAG TPA: PhzF family phenazine biosynthesis protein [Terriglobales bacterium]
MEIPYYHVDAFTDVLFHGNPAGVCVLPAFVPDAVMLDIAAENRHSETAFVVPRPDGDFNLRWFTPRVEDDLCGHATLASAFVLSKRNHDRWPVRFHTCSGVLSVNRTEHGFEMDFPAMPGEACVVPPELLPALGLRNAEVIKARDYMVAAENAEVVRGLVPDIAAIAKLDIGIGGVIVTAPGTGETDYVCRFFPPSIGIAEDPATGSIQCTLAPYWAERLNKSTLRVEQLSPRGARMQCGVAGDRVKIAGQCRLYLQGTIQL